MANVATGPRPPSQRLMQRERPFTVEEYHALAAAGILTEDSRVELLDGRIVAMSPIGSKHLHCVNRLNELFARRLYHSGAPLARISVQNPVRLTPHSEPEPDLVLLRPDAPQDRTPIPDDVLLLIEVADTSADFDRTEKRPRYAAAGIPEYWLVDLAAETVEVARGPEAGRYTTITRATRGDTLAVEALPTLEALPVQEILQKQT
ncbi:Uma2 family endonuclease [Salisaeta longa]|uniref:Uma2 family endonuclease n=1 Tax=Salisaeta longa TaxID=503170 RepID=UPI00146AF53D|nr:Uma2 family endonuclease [Salisaeta longa]